MSTKIETVTDKPVTEKMVKIKIPRGRKDEGDVFVGINERTWLIKRGVEVEVPECVAMLLEDREMMLDRIDAFEAANAN